MEIYRKVLFPENNTWIAEFPKWHKKTFSKSTKLFSALKFKFMKIWDLIIKYVYQKMKVWKYFNKNKLDSYDFSDDISLKCLLKKYSRFTEKKHENFRFNSI